MEQHTLLILGGTGKTGRRVIARLYDLGYTAIRTGSRTGTPAFDWEKPETWDAALEGINTVYLTFQPDLAIPEAAACIEQFTQLATEKGVQKIVLLSGRGEEEARACEQIVIKNAPSWTIVRASWFHQNFSESIFLEPVRAGFVALPRAEALEPFIDAGDIADVVAEALIHPVHNSKIYELTGPRLLTFPEAVAEIALATGREIHFQPLTLEENVQQLRDLQLPEGDIWLVNYLFTEVLDGRNASITHDVEKVLGRKAKDFRQYARETAASGVWDAVQVLHQ